MPLVLLNAPKMAGRLGTRPDLVLMWAQRGRIPSIRTGRGRVRFTLDRVVDALRHAPLVPDDLPHDRPREARGQEVAQ
jgi:uncharacterized membrane protein (DUF2068 family)